MADEPKIEQNETPAAAPKKAKLPEGVVAELPADAVVHVADEVVTSEHNKFPLAPVFSDEFVGKGGTYVTDPETGERKRRYEPFYQNGKVVGYRPVA